MQTSLLICNKSVKIGINVTIQKSLWAQPYCTIVCRIQTEIGNERSVLMQLLKAPHMQTGGKKLGSLATILLSRLPIQNTDMQPRWAEAIHH